MSRCKACGNPYRKGRTMNLLKDDGTIIPIIGCQDCVTRTVKVVTPIGDAKNVCKSCEREPARICIACAVKARRELVAPILANLAGLAKGLEMGGLDAQAEGYRAAIRALEQEAERA